MTLDFRIDWGYQYLYSRRHYHPQYHWDGCLTVENGAITETYQLSYPVIWFGPGFTAKETKLDQPVWQSTTKRGLSGVRFVAEVNPDTVFHLHTASFDCTFTANDVMEKGRIEYSVGPKYLGCCVIVTKSGYYWFRQPLKENEIAIEPQELGLPMHNWMRMDLAWLNPGESVSFPVTVIDNGKDVQETIIHLLGMAAHRYNPEQNEPADGYIPMELTADSGEKIAFNRYYRQHDGVMQILEDDWQRMKLSAGTHTLTLKNCSSLCYCISRITYLPSGQNHGELSVPSWMLLSESLIGKVFAAREENQVVTVGDTNITVDCVCGWNEFTIEAQTPGKLIISTETDTKQMDVYDIAEEADPIKVGYDMTTVPHDDNGFMDWLLDYTARTRLSNYVVFRSFTQGVDNLDELFTRWGNYCRDHGIWVSACKDYLSGALVKASGDMFHDCGNHEYPGVVYARDPFGEHISSDMKEASEKYIDWLKIEIDKAHTVSDCVAFGDASGGIRYSFLAGGDFVRAETMVGHTQTLLSQARPAAEALGTGAWGVHIAIQHGYQPYHENHMGQYFLSLMQPWMMGASTIYEEDSLFYLFKEERQAWDDLCTKGKRDMTRSFFKFVKTHPRKGQNVRRIAFLEGRYAAPFNGFICDVEQDPHYSVWGQFGNPAAEWGHGQPEKCRALLDVLMPGASTQPFRQQFDKRRFFFSGTPYGDFDCIPVEASADYFANYKLLLNLGWNTMIDKDYDKLKSYVADGGTLLTGIPQFSTHTDRAFLKDMDDLSLLNGGDLSELCGIRVNGKGETYCGQWNASGKEKMVIPSLSAMPSDSPDEDGAAILADVTLTDAEVVAWDSFSGKPMLVRKRFGKGYVYTFTIWAYPGHERFQSFAASWIAKLSEENRGETYLVDETGELFYTIWEDEAQKTVMILNTDWTTKGNEIPAVLMHNGKEIALSIKERTAVLVTLSDTEQTIAAYSL